MDLTSDILGSIFKTSRFSGTYAGNGSASAKMALSLQALLLYVRVVIVIVAMCLSVGAWCASVGQPWSGPWVSVQVGGSIVDWSGGCVRFINFHGGSGY